MIDMLIKEIDEMFKISQIVVLILFSSVLTACQTSQVSIEQQKKKLSAARINDRLGMAYLERHDIQRAKQKFLLALDQAPSIPETWYSMGYFLESTGNRNNAKQYYLKAVQLAPARGDVLNNYGTYLCRAGDYQGAVKQFIKATEDSKYLEHAGAYENAGLCSLKIPNYNQAFKYFDRALAEDSNRTVSLIEIAELNYKRSNYKLARQQLEKYLTLASPSAQTFRLEKKIDAKLVT
jgi:type IV pilus assembly protein PilF